MAARITTYVVVGIVAATLIAGLIVVPQLVVAVLAPWVGYLSEASGRKPLLLIGIGAVAARAILFAFVTDYPLMIVVQLLDGISGAIMNVLMVLIITDLTAGTGRFNLAQGVIAAMMGLAASLSTAVTGLMFQALGHVIDFLAMSAVAGAAALAVWAFLPETKPEKYQD